MKFINKTETFRTGDRDCMAKCMQFIHDVVKDSGMEDVSAVRAQLLSEEMIAALINNAPDDADIRIKALKRFGNLSITISAKGDELEIFEMDGDLSDDIGDEEAEDLIRSIILRSHGENLKFNYKKGINTVRITADRSGMSIMKLTMAAFAIGLLFGIIMKFAVPDAVCSATCEYLLSPVNTMFMSALRIVIAPVVFFSIVCCISSFGDLSELGRIGARVMGMYLLTTVIAVFMSYGVSVLINPGKFGAALAMSNTQAVDVNTDVDTSLLHMIINIVPNNLVKPFLEADTLQLIFLAVLIGVAVGRIGKYTPVLSEFFEACNSLFLTMTKMIANFIPIAVFCSVALMMINLGGSSFLSVFGFLCTTIAAIFIMLVVYGLLVLFMTGLNPITFFKKNREGMLTSFTLSSSSAAMPTNIRTCTEKLGISPKVCNFSIPLGATINMDGTCIGLVICGLYLAKMYGVAVTPEMIAPLAITIILLSLGCPGVPGSGLVCLGIVLNQLGVPVEAMGLIIAVNPIRDMFSTMSNTTGDVACALITASKEGLLDKDIYNDMSRM